nr:Chain B, Estrogen receptor [synthetic construct]
IKRSKKNSLA